MTQSQNNASIILTEVRRWNYCSAGRESSTRSALEVLDPTDPAHADNMTSAQISFAEGPRPPRYWFQSRRMAAGRAGNRWWNVDLASMLLANSTRLPRSPHSGRCRPSNSRSFRDTEGFHLGGVELVSLGAGYFHVQALEASSAAGGIVVREHFVVAL